MRARVFFFLGLTIAPIGHAVVAPVIDIAAIAKLGKQLTEMKRQYDMMKQQYRMVERTYKNAQSQLDVQKQWKALQTGHYQWGHLKNTVGDLQ